MAVYNGERYLCQAIESILAQTFEDFEFIIVNDGSTDGTAQILQAYADPRLRLYDHPENEGLAPSLNRGLALAKGRYVARQDADDLSEPDRFAKQVAYLEANPEVALLGSAHIEIDSDGVPLQRVEAHCDPVEILWALYFFCPFVHSAVMFRRDQVLDAVGPYNPSLRYSMDFEYWWRIAEVLPVANLPDPLVRLRLHDASMTATYGPGTREGQALRRSIVAALVGWDHLGEAEQHRRYCNLFTLAAAPTGRHDPEDVHSAVDHIFALHRAFVRERRLSHSDAAAHRTGLRRHVSCALMQLALAENGGRRGHAVQRLAWRAARLDWQASLRLAARSPRLLRILVHR